MKSVLSRTISAATIIAFIVAQCLCYRVFAQATEDYIGSFRYAIADEDGVAQNVRVKTERTGVFIEINVSVTWTPGATVEISSKVPIASIRVTGEQPNQCSEFAFDFVDGFKNAGTATVSVCGATLNIALNETSIREARAVRQYGVYTLLRDTTP